MICNSTELFLNTLREEDIVCHDRDTLYKEYCKWCVSNNYYAFQKTGFTQAILKNFEVKTIRRRVNGKLVTFYERR